MQEIVDTSKPVKVYRNLSRRKKTDPPLYSVWQGGKVKMHLNRVLLSDVKFVVQPAGRRRVLKERRKNVHAFAVGLLRNGVGCFGIDEDGRDFPVHIRYDPYIEAFFVDEFGRKVAGAGGVLLNEHGISACYLEELT